MEPECRCLGAILSPSTGIVDSHAFMQALQGHAEDHGAVVASGTPPAPPPAASARYLAADRGAVQPTAF